MKKEQIFLLLLLSCLINVSKAQSVDVLHLKNGGMIRGNVIEQTPDQTVKIQTSDGSIFIYNCDEVAQITQEEQTKKRRTTSYFKYMGMVDVGYFLDVTSKQGGRNSFPGHRIGLSTSHGYLIIPNIYLGGGVGIHYYYHVKARNDARNQIGIPLFADLRLYPKLGKVKPFINFRFGYVLGDCSGLYIFPSIGLSVKKFDFSIGYNTGQEKLWDQRMYKLRAVSFKVGYNF